MSSLFFYSIYTDTILNDRKPPVAIGGADVQMAMWAKEFAKNDTVYTFSYFTKRIFSSREWGITFCFSPLVRKVMFILNRIKPYIVVSKKPDIIVLRSIPSEINSLEKARKAIKSKLLFMIASDMDVNPDAFGWDKRFPELISKADFVIAQNEYQYNIAKEKLGVKNIALISNIWNGEIFGAIDNTKLYDYIWVGNFREIKRPEWIYEIAKNNPNKRFAVVGASLGHYSSLCDSFNKLSNLDYLGSKTLFETTKLIAKSRCLLCTSVKEGFPNTFLQAFSNNVPVISTVNPNGIIDKYHLGFIADNIETFNDLIKEDAYKQIISSDIETYFKENHSVKKGVETIKKLIANEH